MKINLKMPKKESSDPVCSLDYAFRRIGGKYKGRILWYLHDAQVLRYGQLRKKLHDATTKMLTQTLRELEADNLIHRKVYQEVPPKVEYSLTEIGGELIPFIDYLRLWGKQKMEEEIQSAPQEK